MEGMNFSLADIRAAMGDCKSGDDKLLILLLLLLGGGNYGWGARAAQDPEIMAQLNSLRDTMAGNQNANAIGGMVAGNHDLLHNIAGQMNMGFAGTNAHVNDASTANLLSQKDMQSTMQSCCCDIKTAIMGQTNDLQARIASLANGVTQGFSATAYEAQRHASEIKANQDANTQRILDKMCTSENQALRDRLAQSSQNEQTATLINAMKEVAAG